jgi:hypothetical protein
MRLLMDDAGQGHAGIGKRSVPVVVIEPADEVGSGDVTCQQNVQPAVAIVISPRAGTIGHPGQIAGRGGKEREGRKGHIWARVNSDRIRNDDTCVVCRGWDQAVDENPNKRFGCCSLRTNELRWSWYKRGRAHTESRRC